MTDHKFGTWYPIEELKEFYEGVLFWDVDTVETGYMSKNMMGQKRYRDKNHETIYPAKWMPLPPRPGDE